MAQVSLVLRGSRFHAYALIMIGRTISRYKIVDKIGEGGMGVVYKAEDTELRRTVALKFLPRHLLANDEERARFLHEARAAAALDHPNICTIHEIATVGDESFIVMAYVEGEELGDRISAGPLPLDDAVTFALQISNALHEAHAKRIVHRDIKPSNIIINTKGHAVLMDFGLAKLYGETRITQEGTTVGTVAYMSPEQARGEDVDHRSDIWSLGVILYEMVTGRRPFRAEHQSAVLYAIGNEAPPPLTSLRSDVPMELERIVNKALAKDPAMRYQNVEDMTVDLKSLRSQLRGASGSSGAGARASRASPVARPPSRQRWVLPVIIVAVVVVAAIAFFALRGGKEPATVATSGENSIAVLPLANLGNADNEYFADGMTDEVLTQLARIHSLKVISRTSVMRYKRTEKPITEIARELGVSKVLEGSVLWAGDEVRITLQLIDGVTDAHVWANSYESDVSDVLALQRRVAKAVADEIKVELTPEEEANLAQAPVVDPEAHQLYLQGRYLWNQRTRESLYKSIEYFDAAIEKDPHYALAYVGLADAYSVLPSWIFDRPGREFHEKAKAYALKAEELDPTLAGPHAVLGGYWNECGWDWEKSEYHYRRAIELNPNDATTHQWYSDLLFRTGRLDEALEQVAIARELDPLAMVVLHTQVYIAAGAHDEALMNEAIRKLRELDPDYKGIYYSLFYAYNLLGKRQESNEAWTTYRELTATTEGEREDAKELRAALPQGPDVYARVFLKQCKRIYGESYFLPSIIAALHAELGEADSCMVWLDRGYAAGDWIISLIGIDPRFGPVRDDPRFHEMIRRLNLEEAEQRYLEYQKRRPL